MVKRKAEWSSQALALDFNVASEMDKDLEIPTDFTISSSFDVKEVTKGDDSDDKFVYAYTVSGVSKNKRNWTPEVVRSIGEQVLSKLPVGHLGHIKPKDAGYSLPEPQIVWFGTSVSEEDEVVRLWLKGYILPTADKAKAWIKAKAINSISVWGQVKVSEVDGIQEILEVDLKSIDLSRKLGEGLPAFIAGLAGEMDGSHDELRDAITKKIDEWRRNLPDAQRDNYYWIRRVFNDHVIVNKEGNAEVYRIDYSIDEDNEDVTLDFDNMIELEMVYQPKNKDSIKTEEAEQMVLDWSKVTVADIKENNPSLMTAIANEIANGEKQQNAMEMAGEMDVLRKELKVEKAAEVISMMSKTKTFLGEMASALGMEQTAGESEGSVEEFEHEELIAKAKSIVEEKVALESDLAEVGVALGIGEDETLKGKVSELVEAERLNVNKVQIDAVKEKWTELTKDVNDAVVLEYVNDDFASLLNTKPEDITEADWSSKAIEELTTKLPEKVELHTARLEKVTGVARLAGEMSNIVSLGNGLKEGSEAKAKKIEDMTPKEYAEYLGY